MLTIRTIADEQREKAGMGALIADRRLYLTADGAMVEESDPRAATLLAGLGSEIPMPTVQRLRLSMVDGKVMQDVLIVEDTGATPKQAAKPEDKQAARPKENKAKGGR